MTRATVPSFDPRRPKTAWEKLMERVGRLRPVTWTLINVGNRVDPALMKVSGGKLKLAVGTPTVVLYNRGARSGKLRKTPLLYCTDGDDVILTASNGGAERHPNWFYNVQANPNVELWVGGAGGPYRAHVADAEERARLWPLVTSLYSGYDDYQERAGDREIELVVCSPRS